MRPLPFAIALVMLCAPAFAQTSQSYDAEGKFYEDCVKLAYQDPDAALDKALSWRDTGGGLPARHCVAIAYTELKKYTKAAEEFEAMADDMRRGLGWNFADTAPPKDRGLLVDAYAQAGNAWMLANDPAKAYELFTLALSEAKPGTQQYADNLVDRSIARAAAGDYQGAIDDISAAQKIAKESVGLYVLKASAYRALKNYDQAAVELGNAFRLNPKDREALLERGNLRRETGDDDGARTDWLEYLRLYPNSPEAEAVRDNLANMDIKLETPKGDEASKEPSDDGGQ